jgi:outer membrane protein TolC
MVIETRIERASSVLLVIVLAATASRPARGQEALALDEAIHLAVQSHPSIASAQAEAIAAKAKPGQVSSWDDPVLSFMTGIPLKSPADPPLVEMKLTQTFPLSAVYGHKAGAAEAMADAFVTKVPQAELDVALEVALAYYRVVFLEEERAVVEKQLELAGSVVEAATLRFASLSGDQADVIRARIAYEETETDLEVIEIDLRAAREVLVLLLGDGRDPESFAVSAPAYPSVTQDAETLTAQALTLRPELAYLDAKAVALDAQEKAAKSSYAPFLSVSAGYQYKSNTLAGLMGEDAIALGLAINLPFMVGKRKGAVDEAGALAQANDAEKQAAVLAIARQILELRSALSALEERIALQDEKVIPEAGLALDLTLAAYAAQKSDITDVLSALEKLLVAERKRSRLRGEYFTIAALLQRQVGTFEGTI